MELDHNLSCLGISESFLRQLIIMDFEDVVFQRPCGVSRIVTIVTKATTEDIKMAVGVGHGGSAVL